MEDNAEIVYEVSDEALEHVGPSINHLSLFLKSYCTLHEYNLSLGVDIYTMANGEKYIYIGHWVNFKS